VLSGKFLAGGGTKLYGLDPETGIPRYTLTLPSPVVDHFGSPSAAGGRVFVATGSTVTAYQIADLRPTVVTEAASSVGQTAATLNATVNPHGWTVSECRFEYGPTEAYGASVPCASLPGGGGSPVAVSVHISGLQANTTYHFRVVAFNPGGTSYGSDETLLTASTPLVVPIGGTSSSQGSAPDGTGASANGVSAFTEHVLPAPVASLLSRSLTASRSGSVKVKLGCTGQSSCVGAVTLRTLSPVPTGGTSKGTGVLALAAGSFDLAGGRDGSIVMHLSAKARKLLQRMHTLRVRAGIAWHAPAGSAHTGQIILTLRLAKNAR
jgi:hypothetical protein